MAQVKWIKIVTDIFDDEKILLIEAMPEADSIITIWFKLLCLAGKQNNGGVFMLNDRIAYTDEMFATIFRRKINTVRLALKTFEDLGMVEVINGTVTIPNWSKHQSLDQLERKTAYMREYMANRRAEQKQLASGKANSKANSITDGQSNGSDVDKNKIRIEEDKIREDKMVEDRETPTPADELVAYAANNLQYLSPTNVEELDSFRDSLTDEMIRYAIDEACANGVRTYAYARKILNRMVERGFKSLGEVKAAEEERKAKQAAAANVEPAVAQNLRKAQYTRRPMDERKEVPEDDAAASWRELMNRPRSGAGA